MSKFKIEIQITLLTVIIAGAVVTSGYFVYNSLSTIIQSIHQETGPDYNLFVIKDISADLAELENSVRLYILTNQKKDLVPCNKLQSQVAKKIKNLEQISWETQEKASLADTIRQLSLEKLALWGKVLELHESKKDSEPAFSELYSKLEETKIDTIQVETEKKGFLRGIFGGKKVTVDTTYVERKVENEEIKEDLQNLELEMKEKGKQIKILESQLIEQNLILDEKMSLLIARAEKIESDNLIIKSNQADRMADSIYKRLAAFSAAVVALLLIVLFLLYNYMRKSRAHQHALKEAKSEAEMLAKAKEKFASNVSHEMRTPVNAIYGLAEQLLQQKTESNISEQISVIAQSANHLKNIINDTLDFSKIQSKKLKIDAIHFSPGDVFSEIVTLQKNEAEKKGIKLGVTIKNELSDALIGDPLRLKQILINLVNNALKFTEVGEVTIEVKTIQVSNNIIRLHIKISDTGIGIPQEDIKQIFDEFVQVESQNGRKYSGTGLGLSIVKKLIELQDGRIEVSSEPGKGTEVSFSIPYKKGDSEKIEKSNFISFKIPERFRDLSVLVADDEEFNRFLMKGIFKKWGAKYKEVYNGNDAVNVALKEDFDIILMDVRMPGKNGTEATKSILKYKPETNIIAVTATNEKIDEETCKAAGMKGFLLKPFSEKELIDKISLILPANIKSTSQKTSSKVNLREARRFANGDELFLKEMTELFIKTTKAGFKDIQKAIQEKDFNAVAEISHKMAPPCKHFEAADLYNAFKQVENAAKTNTDWNLLNLQISNLQTEIHEVHTFLTNHLNLKQN